MSNNVMSSRYWIQNFAC